MATRPTMARLLVLAALLVAAAAAEGAREKAPEPDLSGTWTFNDEITARMMQGLRNRDRPGFGGGGPGGPMRKPGGAPGGGSPGGGPGGLKPEKGPARTESWTLSNDGKRLFLTLSIKGGPPIPMRRAYDRAEG